MRQKRPVWLARIKCQTDIHWLVSVQSIEDVIAHTQEGKGEDPFVLGCVELTKSRLSSQSRTTSNTSGLLLSYG